MEKYANNLEVLVDERTDQLQEEKKKTGVFLVSKKLFEYNLNELVWSNAIFKVFTNIFFKNYSAHLTNEIATACQFNYLFQRLFLKKCYLHQ